MFDSLVLPWAYVPLLAGGGALCLILLLQLVKLWRRPSGEEDARSAGRRLASLAVTAVFSLAAIAWLLLQIGLAARISLYEDFFTALDEALQASFLFSGIVYYLSYRFIGGGLVLLIAVFGLLAVLIHWRRLRRAGQRAGLRLAAGAGLYSAMWVLAAGLLFGWWEHIQAFKVAGDAGTAEKRMLLFESLSAMTGLKPFGWLTLALLVGGGLAAAAGAWRGRAANAVRPAGRGAVAVGLLVLACGAGLFALTRAHDSDADRIAELLASRDEKVYTGILTADPRIHPPVLANVQAVERAPAVAVQGPLIVFEGLPVGRLDDWKSGTPGVIPDMASRLARMAEQYRLLHPGRDALDRITLHLDRHLPGRVLHSILLTCHRAGYSRPQLAGAALRRFDSAVLGEQHGFAIAFDFIPFELSDQPHPAALAPPLEETLGAWAKKLDAAAGRGRVAVWVERGRSERKAR